MTFLRASYLILFKDGRKPRGSLRKFPTYNTRDLKLCFSNDAESGSRHQTSMQFICRCMSLLEKKSAELTDKVYFRHVSRMILDNIFEFDVGHFAGPIER